MRELILAYQGEMALKGLNRATFESILVKTMRRRLKSLGDFRVYKAQSTMYAEPQDDAAAAHMDEAFERVKKIFGIAAVSRAAVCDKTFDSISATAVEYLRGALEQEALIAGEESDYGLFVKTVDGVTADDANQEWWCFTKGGEMLETGVDSTPIADGDTFEITLTQGY